MTKKIICYKKILKEWNYDKNNQLGFFPEQISNGSSKKVWWKCSACGHEWNASPKNRIKSGTGCPLCALKKIGINHNKALINKNGSLEDNMPKLAQEWNYEKNGILKPSDVTPGSGKKVWWKCKNGHEWEARIDHRASGSKCIYCKRQKAIIGENDLKTTNPELVEEWDYEKNTNIKPEEFMAGSNRMVWWKCALGHSWRASINHRTGGTGCPYCYSEYGTSFPEQAICYYLSKITIVKNRYKIDNQEIDIYLPKYRIGFEYDGAFYHNSKKSKAKERRKNEIIGNNEIQLFHIKESNRNIFNSYKRVIYCKTDRDYKYLEYVLEIIQQILNCKLKTVNIENDAIKIYSQYVKGRKQNSFAITNEKLLKEWDYERNEELLPENFTSGTNKKIWWKCSECGSSYLASVNHRTSGTACPYCNGKKVNETNCLANRYPDLCKFWNYNKNSMKPEDIYFRSRKKVWWICGNCRKEFEAPICSRIRAKRYECPECMHKHIGDKNRIKANNKSNNLAINRPDLVKEWNYEKNYPLSPKDVTTGSGIKVWWNCSKCNNIWQATIRNRTLGTGCPKCYNTSHRK